MQIENENMAIEEIFRLKELENAWRRSLPRENDPLWLKVFPEAKEFIPVKIEEWQDKADFILLCIQAKLLYLKVFTSDDFSYWFYREWFKNTYGPGLVVAKKNIRRLKRLISEPSKSSLLSENQIQSAKSVPLDEVFETRLRRVGKNYVGLCPFHKEHSPSFYIYSDTNTYICFGCQAKGDVISYVMQIKNLTFKEAVLWLLKG